MNNRRLFLKVLSSAALAPMVLRAAVAEAQAGGAKAAETKPS